MAQDPHPDALNALAHADHGAPEQILGAHYDEAKRQLIVRTMRPYATQLEVLVQGREPLLMARIHDNGLYQAVIDSDSPKVEYQYRATNYDGTVDVFYDPYIFPSFFGEMDIYLLGEGRHLEAYNKLGAHLREVDGVQGVNFAVWAPNARRVSLMADCNRWDARVHPMKRVGQSGIWEIFIPGVGTGLRYKYEIRSHHMGYQAMKADPYAFWAEVRPSNASIVVDLAYEWGDEAWMARRAQIDPLAQPMAIYEVHLGSWKRKEGNQWYTYRELATELIPYVKEMGYTHIELMPVAEHPYDGSWGYQVTGYYAPTSRFGTPQDFMYFVDQCHQNGIGVFLDWVPAHFPKDGWALSYFDGTHLYSHADPRLGEHPDWGTYIFNYARNEVRNFLTANALFWLKKYHIDGLRVDAVSSMLYLDFSRKEGQWIPNRYGGRENLDAVAFIREFNELVHRECPGALTIAEESTSWAMVSRPTDKGGLGFTFKWNMGWMHDTLNYVKKDPIHRKYAHNMMTFSMLYAYTENFVLSLSHDEVVHGKGSLIAKMAGDWWQKFAGTRLLLGYQYTHPGKKLNFMGHEIAQWREWNYAASLEWSLLDFPMHREFQQWVKDVNTFYRSEPSLYEQDFSQAGFRWIEPNDALQSVFSYIRMASDPLNFLVIVCNFTPVVRQSYRIGVPEAGHYAEVLNSDAARYGGSGMSNGDGRTSDDIPMHGFAQSIDLTLPPLAVVILKLRR
ncbi:MAG: 1,4-alpha-glucan branching protein GlgB [Anaerolineae bacterium]|nr:1,4-alpha-glucan branching protein GlgB [Anaerolineae bacterium]MDW8171384.1 1,4-alpha-glucan branching protein GlgB [Anaerolineae bacterium]